MDLWIRSQDRQDLIRVDGRFHVQETSVNPHSHKWGILIDGRCYYAEYSTEERALEVLDEIQELLEPVHIVEVSKKEAVIGANILYKMPKE